MQQENRLQTNEKSKVLHDRREQRKTRKGGRLAPPHRPPTLFLQSWDLAHHESFMRSVPAK